MPCLKGAETEDIIVILLRDIFKISLIPLLNGMNPLTLVHDGSFVSLFTIYNLPRPEKVLKKREKNQKSLRRSRLMKAW